MTMGDWDALFIDMPEKVKKWFASIGLGTGTDHHNHRLSPSLADGSDEQSSR